MKRIDTHQHLWDPAQFPYSWCAGIPALNRRFHLEEYLAAVAKAGVAKTVFVECDVDEPFALAEAGHIQKLAHARPLIAGIVAAARPERADFPAQLEELRKLPNLRGIRRVLHVAPDETSRGELFRESVRSLAGHGLTFDICVLARQLPLAIELARACPEVHFILDHCGVPDVAGKAFDPWRAHIAELAALPNVACKISGLPSYAGANWAVDDLHPWVEHVLACFGWDRVMWGGDWPVCTLTSTLQQWVEASDRLVASANEANREKLFWRNAEAIYRL